MRHLVRQNPDKVKMEDFDESGLTRAPKRRYVALHHFHPAVVRAFYENPLTSAQKHKVPISITEHELQELGMEKCEEDQILSVSGVPTGGYYFVPSYPQNRAHEDLKTLIHAVRAMRQKPPKLVKAGSGSDVHSTPEKTKVPTDIEITGPSSTKNEPPNEVTSADTTTTTTTTTTDVKEDGRRRRGERHRRVRKGTNEGWKSKRHRGGA